MVKTFSVPLIHSCNKFFNEIIVFLSTNSLVTKSSVIHLIMKQLLRITTKRRNALIFRIIYTYLSTQYLYPDDTLGCLVKDSSLKLPHYQFPTSSSIGRHCCGGIPPIAVYRDSLPMGIPMPNAPRSPSPRILSPSVTTIACGNRLVYLYFNVLQ